MQSEDPVSQNGWDEQISQTFIDYGRYFVPERERQMQIIVGLIPRLDQPCSVLDLGCGEGLLAEAILEHYSTCTVFGLDGSAEMLRRAQERLERFGERFQGKRFDLFKRSWPDTQDPLHTVVSSLVIHHLDGPQKQMLFRDVQGLLVPRGAFIIADLVEPAHPSGRDLAAQAWDEAVRERALELDGDMDGFNAFEHMRWNTYRYFDPEDIDKPSRLFDQLKWLEQAGFVDIDVYWMRAGHAIFGGWKSGKEAEDEP